jgi:hypothetical protein
MKKMGASSADLLADQWAHDICRRGSFLADLTQLDGQAPDPIRLPRSNQADVTAEVETNPGVDEGVSPIQRRRGSYEELRNVLIDNTLTA